MKQRIRIDGSLMILTVVLTVILYFFSNLHTKNIFWDNVCTFLGLMFLLKGTYLRMAARGYKKEFSNKGHGLVTEGLYTLTRNPMYLGTSLIGSGFLLIVWPWWFLAIFAVLFFVRFNKQMVAEEAHLSVLFGEQYKKYCQETPRFLPSIKSLVHLKMNQTFPWNMCWSTKERFGLLGWPLLAFILKMGQQYVVFQSVDMTRLVCVFALTIAIFALGLTIRYRFNI